MAKDLMERAWPKEDYGSVGSSAGAWDAGRLGKALAGSVKAWVEWEERPDDVSGGTAERETEWAEWSKQGRERIMDEAAGTVKDILHELDSREDQESSNGNGLDDDEAHAVGETLYSLAGYILHLRCGFNCHCSI